MSDTSWIQRWKTSKPTEPRGPRQMTASEEIANLRKSPELRDRRHPGYVAAQARLTALYRELYGDAVEDDNAR
jgi:hypothetical protein